MKKTSHVLIALWQPPHDPAWKSTTGNVSCAVVNSFSRAIAGRHIEIERGQDASPRCTYEMMRFVANLQKTVVVQKLLKHIATPHDTRIATNLLLYHRKWEYSVCV